MAIQAKPKFLISCDHCSRPVFEVRNGVAIIMSDHYNKEKGCKERHYSFFSLDKLRELLLNS